MSMQKLESRQIVKNKEFIQKANDLKPTLFKERCRPNQIVKMVPDSSAIHGWKTCSLEPATELKTKQFGKGDSFIVDFGTHRVGYLSMNIKPVGSPPDAPLHMKLIFGEMPVEVSESFSGYDGWISSSWLQEESIHIDTLPNQLVLPRRYSFRFLKVEILDTSLKYKVSFRDIFCDTVTSADKSKVLKYSHVDEELQTIDKVSIKTLEDCMQDVFEDGPKRDRRLWLGDLRLQALANYKTFNQNNLVKRCLYLFAGLPNEHGQVSANIFINPTPIPDDTYLFDYSLFFTTTLHDYYKATNDMETLIDLWPTAFRQIELALEKLDKENIVIDESTWWSFIDWNDHLNKQASSQGVLIYALKKALGLAAILKKEVQRFLSKKIEEITRSTLLQLWDIEAGFFVSGKDKQISWASQVWMVLANVLDKEQNRKLMNRLLDEKPSIVMNTPYMYHHLVEALLLVGEKEKAIKIIKHYWGGMINHGADTFWELYNPDDKNYSPYGSNLINSYCHAWSCTPTYLIRKYHI